jgi:copper chaperone CopZ
MAANRKITVVLSGLLLGLLVTIQANSTTVQRSNFIVDNLACTSCLATIEAELKGLPGALGMNADLSQRRVTVDHLSSLTAEQIGAAISRLGYPATMDWTASLPQQNAERFAGGSRYSSGCSSGGCGLSGGNGAGLTAWKAAPAGGTVSRTTLQVSNLSCTSCLANIAAELSKLPETYGMNGYLSRGVVLVDHADTLENNRIAAIISGLGYPARVVATNEIAAQNAFAKSQAGAAGNPQVRPGLGCGSKGPCNATSSSWQELYNRYVSRTNSK